MDPSEIERKACEQRARFLFDALGDFGALGARGAFGAAVQRGAGARA